jgi:hypothetical protein
MRGGPRGADVDGGKRLLRIGGRRDEQGEHGEGCACEEMKTTDHDMRSLAPTRLDA